MTAARVGLVALVAFAIPALGQDAYSRTDAVTVKLRDGLSVRVHDGRLTDLETSTLGDLGEQTFASGWRWHRSHTIDAELLSALRRNAERNLGRGLPDPNLQLDVELPAGVDVASALRALRAHSAVEHALPLPLPAPPPTPPDFTGLQGYAGAAPAGLGIQAVSGLAGGTGALVSVADLEYSWNLNHADLGLNASAFIGAAGPDPFSDTNHGTAVLGVLHAVADGSGVTGMAHGCATRVVSTYLYAGPGGWNVGAAITTALTALVAGDVILLEQQMYGPGPGYDYVPVEWHLPWYNAIVLAVGNGVTVVEAAANGQQNLDDALYSTGNGGHYPFLSGNESGAIIVGAGAVSSDPAVDRTRLWFSNWGSAIDLQGWGHGVATTGYGSLYSAEGQDQWYTAGFNGTSSASATVAGACAILQSSFKAATGTVLSPQQLLTHIATTGSAQPAANAAIEPIGPRPDVAQARIAALAPWTPQLWVDVGTPGVVGVGNFGLQPAREYFNVFSLEMCPTGVGTGPLLGLYAQDLSFILLQVSLPAGAEPFHFISSGTVSAFGPYGVPGGIYAEALCADVTGGQLWQYSPVIAFMTQ